MEFRVICPSDAKIFCDPGLVQEVLYNLIQNSVEAMKEEGQLTVEFKDRNSRFSCIQVSDSGTGLPEIKDNIFLPMYL